MTTDSLAAPPAPEERAWPRSEFNPRTGCYVLVSVMEKRRAKARARNTPTQARLRAAKKAQDAYEFAVLLGSAEIAELTDGIEIPSPERPSFTACLRDARALRDWLRTDAPRQRQYRPLARRYLATRIVVEAFRLNMMDPQPRLIAPEISRMMGHTVDRYAAKNLLSRLATLEGEGGPWWRPLELPAITEEFYATLRETYRRNHNPE